MKTLFLLLVFVSMIDFPLETSENVFEGDYFASTDYHMNV